MNNTLKVIVGIVVVLVLTGLLYIMGNKNPSLRYKI